MRLEMKSRKNISNDVMVLTKRLIIGIHPATSVTSALLTSLHQCYLLLWCLFIKNGSCGPIFDSTNQFYFFIYIYICLSGSSFKVINEERKCSPKYPGGENCGFDCYQLLHVFKALPISHRLQYFYKCKSEVIFVERTS